MANHKSALKRIRSNNAKRIRNKYQHKTARSAISALRSMTEKDKAEAMLPKIYTMLDRLAKKNIIHKNKAANLKSSLASRVSALS